MKKGFVAFATIFLLCAVMILTDNAFLDNDADYTMGQVSAYASKVQGVPYIQKDGMELICVAEAIEMLGGRVRQEEDALKIQYNGVTAEMKAGQKTAEVNGYDVLLSYAPEALDGKVYMPVQFFSNFWSLDPHWQEDIQYVQLVKLRQSGPVIVHNIWQDEDINPYSLEIPVVLRVNDKLYEKQLNKVWNQVFTTILDIYKIESETFDTTRLDGAIFSSFASDDIISIGVSLEKDIEGQFFGVWTYNVDLNKQKTIQLEDLFIQGRMDEALASYFPDGLEWLQENENTFCVTSDAIYVYAIEEMWQNEPLQEPVRIPMAEIQNSLRYDIFS